jgi:hypothetical protein
MLTNVLSDGWEASTRMDSSLKPIIKRQIVFLIASLGAGLVLTYFFGFIIGVTANIVIFVAAIFYIRHKQAKALGTFGFGSETGGRGGYHADGSIKIRYACLVCGEEVKGTKCSKCGSNMKKPVF